MKKYEYKWVRLSKTHGLTISDKKMDEITEKLNELGQDGWLLIENSEFPRYVIFAREIKE